MPKLNKPAIPGYEYANPEQTSGKSYIPHPEERVFDSQKADVERIKKGLDTSATRPQNRSQVQNAAGRAITRTLGRAGLAQAALDAGYEVGRAIDEKTGIGKKIVEKSGLGDLAERVVNSRDKVQLSKESKERLDAPNASFRKSEQNEDSGEMATHFRPYKSGGKVSSASSRADGIAQRGKTRGKMC